MKPAPSIELMTHTHEDVARATKRKRWLLGCVLLCFTLCTLLAAAWVWFASH